MNKNLIHIGLDVDDTQYHGAAFDRGTGEIVSFKCRPTLKGLVSQLEKTPKANLRSLISDRLWPDRDSCERYSYLLILAGYCSEAGRKYKSVWITNSVG